VVKTTEEKALKHFKGSLTWIYCILWCI